MSGKKKGVDKLKNVSHVLKFSFFLISSVQWLSRVGLFVTLWTAACQASLSITNAGSLLKLMSIELEIGRAHV